MSEVDKSRRNFLIGSIAASATVAGIAVVGDAFGSTVPDRELMALIPQITRECVWRWAWKGALSEPIYATRFDPQCPVVAELRWKGGDVDAAVESKDFNRFWAVTWRQIKDSEVTEINRLRGSGALLPIGTEMSGRCCGAYMERMWKGARAWNVSMGKIDDV